MTGVGMSHNSRMGNIKLEDSSINQMPDSSEQDVPLSNMVGTESYLPASQQEAMIGDTPTNQVGTGIPQLNSRLA